MLVKETNLSLIQTGDILLFKAAGLMNGDFIGELIADLEGGRGRYTHGATVRDKPDPNAEVTEVRPGIFKVNDSNPWTESYQVETQYDNESITLQRLRSKRGIKLEATYPRCQESTIDWDNKWMEVWRCRYLTDDNIKDIIHAQEDMLGWDYNIAEFLSFGMLNQAAAKICSQFVAEPIYNTTLFRGTANGKYAIALTPDLAGIKDPELTPNDLYESGYLFRVRYQGLLGT